jgi:hypothetical protein
MVVRYQVIGPEKVAMRATRPASDLPPYVAVIGPVTARRLGASWCDDCPVGVHELRLVSLSRLGFDGGVHRGQLVVAADLAAELAHVFADLYFARFPVERMDTVEKLGADDARSMAANNSSAFNCRPITGGTAWSRHAYGRAVDVNPVQNPYVGPDGTVRPRNGMPYVDRTVGHPGLIRPDGLVVRAFERRGWTWGGHWDAPVDYHHFEKP